MKKARNWMAMPRDLLERTVTLDCDEDGEPYSTPSNVSRVLEAGFGGCLRWDAFTRQLTLTGMAPWCGYDWPDGQWRDEHATRLSIMLSTQRMTAASALVHELAHELGRRRAFNSLTEHVTALEWDGVARVEDLFAAYFEASTSPSTRAASRVFMLGLAARALKPGCKVDTCLVLEGGQGAKKSQALAMLAGGPDRFLDTMINIEERSGIEALRGKWIIEFGEGVAASRASREGLKAFLSARVDTYRAPYARTTEDYPRQCVFGITTNDVAILTDPTGSRRFLPVSIGAIDLEGLEQARDQLLAEAVARVLAGEQWWPTDAEVEPLRELGEEFTVIDPREEKLLAWLERPAQVPGKARGKAVLRTEVTTSEVADAIDEPQGVRTAQFIAGVFQRLGWVAKLDRKQAGGTRHVRRSWVRPAGQS